MLKFIYPSGECFIDNQKIPKMKGYFHQDILNPDLTLKTRSNVVFLGIGKGNLVFIPRLNDFYQTTINCTTNCVYTVIPWDNGVVTPIASYGNLQSIDSQHYMQLLFPELNYLEKDIDLTPVMPMYNELESLTPIDVMSIDPSVNFAEDVDDAISFDFDGDFLNVSVHIADVSRYLDILGSQVPLNCETIYTLSTVYHMLPHKLMQMCSLNANENRYAISVHLKFNAESKELISSQIERTVVRNVNKMNYDTADSLIETNPEFKRLYLFVNTLNVGSKISHLFTHSSYYFKDNNVLVVNNNTPSHVLVEKLMILANNIVTEEVISRGTFNVYRHHPEPELLGDSVKLTDIPKAVYSPKSGHYALQLETYNHFTSPIRRFMDICIHKALYTDKDIVIDLDKYNEERNLIRQASRAEYTLTIFRFLQTKLYHSFNYTIIDKKETFYQIVLPDYNIYTTIPIIEPLPEMLKLTGVNLVKLRLYFSA